MKYRASLLLCLCVVMHTVVCATACASAGATTSAAVDEAPEPERNRVTVEKKPGLALSASTTVDILDGEIGRELWRVNFQPALAAELSFAGGLSAGVTLPFAIEAGYPFYGAGSFEGNIGPPRIRIDFTGSSSAVYYRFGVSFTLAGTSGISARGAEAVPAAGGSVSVACIRDPLALKFEADAEVAPAPIGGKWGFRGAGGAAGVLAVLNEVISLELGVIVNLQMNAIGGAPPPSVIGRTGLYARMNSFVASLFVNQNLWNPTYPASVSAGIGISWGTQ